MQFVGYFSGNHMSFLITLPGPCSRGLAWRRSKHKTGVEFFIRMPQTDMVHGMVYAHGIRLLATLKLLLVSWYYCCRGTSWWGGC
jgi:hypothetical protein